MSSETPPCDIVAERLALGESLGDAEEHVATCPACSRLITLPRLVAAAAHAAEPNPGFVIRSTSGARSKLALRRRNRIATNSIAALAAVAIGVWAVQTPVGTSRQALQLPGMATAPQPLSPINSNPDRPTAITPLTDDQIGAELVHISDFDRVMAPSPQWRDAQAPLGGYRLVVKQGALR